MAIIGEKITLDKTLVGNIARNQMESKMELTAKGALYVGTGNKNSVIPDGGGTAVPIPITSHIAPNGASDDGKVLVADSNETVGWKITKITADNLEGGRVEQATNADKTDAVSYNGDYKSFTDAFVSACLLKIYPVGSIYMSVNNVNPSTFLGGTWEAWGAGKVPVGVDTNDTNFATVEQTGGEKQHTLTIAEMPEHNHTIPCTPTANDGSEPSYQAAQVNAEATGYHNSIVAVSSGGGSPHNNLQPYITCYMWKRTA